MLLPLAQSSEGSGWAGFLVPIAFFIIWALGALSNYLSKQQRQEEARRRAEEMARSAPNYDQIVRTGGVPQSQRPPPPPPPVLPPRQPTRMDVPRPVPPQQQQRPPVRRPPPPPPLPPRRKQQQAKKPKVPAAVPPPVPPAPVEQDVTVNLVATAGRGTSFGDAPRAAARPRLPKLTHATLRQQMILSEVLGPPLALRDDPANPR